MSGKTGIYQLVCDFVERLARYHALIIGLGKPSAHYSESDPDWAPSLKLGHDGSFDSAAIATVSGRHDRFLARRRRQQEEQLQQEIEEQCEADDLDADISCDDLNNTCELLCSLILFKVNHIILIQSR